MTGRIFDIKRFAIHDGPGIRTTVFLKGCPLNCLWCQNPEGIDSGSGLWIKQNQCIGCGLCFANCLYGAISFEQIPRINLSACQKCWTCVNLCPSKALRRIDSEVSALSLMQELLLDKLFYDVSGGGVTLSGGEPLTQPEFVFDLLELLKKEGIHTCLETSLFAPLQIICKLKNVLNYLICDIKLIDEKEHCKFTGESNRIILDNFRSIADFPNILVRVPLIPGITAKEENLKAIGEFVRSVRKDIEIELLNYNWLCGSKYVQLDKPHFNTEAAAFSQEEMDKFYSWIPPCG